MNYRHAYHAGNHTEVFKHAALVLILEHLRRKPKPFMVLDTHAGLGSYDLRSEEALRTREAEAGIGRVMDAAGTAVRPYLDLVRAFGGPEPLRYPGSPRIVQALLRGEDRLVACELHPVDVVALRSDLGRDSRVAVHHRDGHEAMRALLPPHERRGLVFIDPPYERRDEAARLGRSLLSALRKWPTGTYAAWYPIKDRSLTDPLPSALAGAGVTPVLRAELTLGPEDGRLVGGGLLIVNPPWQFDGVLEALGAELVAAFEAPGGRWAVDWLAPEVGREAANGAVPT